MNDDRYIFRNTDNVGVAEAEEDSSYLSSCFVDTGYVELLQNPEDPRRLILGRTGSGKSALLQRLQSVESHVISIQPINLALEYLSNSNILEFFASIGVELDLFFKLLWRHVLAVEVLRYKHSIATEEQSKQIFGGLRARFTSKEFKKGIEYLEQWGNSFWLETDHRIVEIAQKLEESLVAKAGVETSVLQAGAEGASKLSQEIRSQVQSRAQKVINSVQMSELSSIIKLLDEILDDPNNRVFVVLDKLDEGWISEKLRYRILRALIESIRDFRTVSNLKIIAALRVDLIERVFRITRTPGFQEEKYSSMYLNIEWNSQNLFELLNKRVRHLVQNKYAKKSAVSLSDVLPSKVSGEQSFDFLVSRTMRRPRDAIAFFNACVSEAAGHHRMTNKMIVTAEGHYSRGRLRALADEWGSDYPHLLTFAELLKGRPTSFCVSSINDKQCQDFALGLACDNIDRSDDLSSAAMQLAEGAMSATVFRSACAQAFYRVGLIGVKLSPEESTLWSLDGRRSISAAEFTDAIRIAPHPMFYRALGVRTGTSESSGSRNE